MEKKNLNVFAESVKNLYRDITVTDKIKGEKTTFKAVFGKYGDLERDVSKAYKLRLTNLILALQKYAETDGNGNERNKAITSLQAVADFYSTSIASIPKFTIQKKDFEYFYRYAFTQRVDKVERLEVNSLGMDKVNKQFQRLMYYKVNKIKTPSVTFNKSTQNAINKLSKEKKEQKQKKANEKSTKVLKKDAKTAQKRIDEKAAAAPKKEKAAAAAPKKEKAA